MMRGYFEIGIYRPKTAENVGTLWRTAYQLGAYGMFTIGERYSRQPSDTYHVGRHVPFRHYCNFSDFFIHVPLEAVIVAVETGGRKALSGFNHPQQAIYLLGAEDDGIPEDILRQCNEIVSIESVGRASYNVAVAGSLVMYHRQYGKA